MYEYVRDKMDDINCTLAVQVLYSDFIIDFSTSLNRVKISELLPLTIEGSTQQYIKSNDPNNKIIVRRIVFLSYVHFNTSTKLQRIQQDTALKGEKDNSLQSPIKETAKS